MSVSDARPRGALLAAIVGGLTTAMLGAVAPAAGAQARDVEALRLASLAASCAQCHGTEGRAPIDASVPGLAGRRRELLLERLVAFRTDTRSSTVMAQLVKGYTEAQLSQLASYFASRAP